MIFTAGELLWQRSSRAAGVIDLGMSATSYCLTLLLVLLSTALGGEPARITIDLSKPGPEINPRMYGIFLEKINHGVDGGLYGELIRNRAFEDARPPEGYEFRNGRWRDS